MDLHVDFVAFVLQILKWVIEKCVEWMPPIQHKSWLKFFNYANKRVAYIGNKQPRS